MAAKTAPSVVVTSSEILDVKTLSQTTREESDNIQERLKLEETKAALQAAREGMERQAQRLKEEEQQQQTTAATTTTRTTTPSSGRFSAAAANISGVSSSGAKWVPPHLRAGGGTSLTTTTTRARPVSSQKLDTKDETLFPDLNTAGQILQQEKKHESVAYKPPKKTPVGGTWASSSSRTTAVSKSPAVKEAAVESKPAPEANPAPTTSPETKPAVPAPTTRVPAAQPTATEAKTTTVKKKKKKKDISTFKSS